MLLSCLYLSVQPSAPPKPVSLSLSLLPPFIFLRLSSSSLHLQRQVCAVVASLSRCPIVPGEGFLQVGHGCCLLQVNHSVELTAPWGLLGATFEGWQALVLWLRLRLGSPSSTPPEGLARRLRIEVHLDVVELPRRGHVTVLAALPPTKPSSRPPTEIKAEYSAAPIRLAVAGLEVLGLRGAGMSQPTGLDLNLDLFCVDIVLQGVTVDPPPPKPFLVVPVGRPWTLRKLVLVKVLLLFLVLLLILLLVILVLLLVSLQGTVLPHRGQRRQVLVIEQSCPPVTTAHPRAPLTGVPLGGQRRWAVGVRVEGV